jgi:hypothetical protein
MGGGVVVSALTGPSELHNKGYTNHQDAPAHARVRPHAREAWHTRARVRACLRVKASVRQCVPVHVSVLCMCVCDCALERTNTHLKGYFVARGHDLTKPCRADGVGHVPVDRYHDVAHADVASSIRLDARLSCTYRVVVKWAMPVLLLCTASDVLL